MTVAADSLDRFFLVQPVVLYLVQWCEDCDGERPHFVTDHIARCKACGRTEL